MSADVQLIIVLRNRFLPERVEAARQAREARP